MRVGQRSPAELGACRSGPHVNRNVIWTRGKVTPWQKRARDKVGALLQSRGHSSAFATVPVATDAMLDHRPGDVYLTTSFERGTSRYEIYIYKDEAGVMINGNWTAFELPDWDSDREVLLGGFLEYLTAKLERPSSHE